MNIKNNWRIYLLTLAGLAFGLLFLQKVTKVFSAPKIFESGYSPDQIPEQQPSTNSTQNQPFEDNPQNNSPYPQQNIPPSAKNSGLIQKKAEAITVKVLSGPNSGSGILLTKKGNIYQVITNDHVILFGRPNQAYKIQTPDNQIYSASVVQSTKFKNYDLALLEFRSDQNYQLASLYSIPSIVNAQEVFAAGFPAEKNPNLPRGFLFSEGKIEAFSVKPFSGGYQIGYTNTFKKGMSGGPLLNSNGQVIAINGVHKYPLWGNPYTYQDGSKADIPTKDKISNYNWAIPLETLLKLAPDLRS